MARYDTRPWRLRRSMIWARMSSKVMGDPPLSGLCLSVSAKMTQNGTEEKGGSRWRRFSSVSNTTGVLWIPKLLTCKHFHGRETRKPHEHRPNSEIGRVRGVILSKHHRW